MFTSVLLYKVEVVRLSRPTTCQTTVDVEISNFICALSLDQALVNQQANIHGEFLTFLLIVSSPKLRSRRLRHWLYDLWDVSCGCLRGNEFNHHTSITLTALIAPLALHLFSIFVSAFCAIAKIVTLIKNSVFTSVLLYKIELIRHFRSNRVHQAAVDVEISNLISALSLNQALVNHQHYIHGEFLAF